MTDTGPRRSILLSIFRGIRKRCPNCGTGRIFKTYIKPTGACSACDEKLDHIRTDDFAPWLMILVTGHVIVSLVFYVELTFAPPLWVHAALWTPTTVLLVLALLPHAKGACLGLMWALRLRGDETQ